MVKLYYSDPLAAAYMVREYQVKIIREGIKSVIDKHGEFYSCKSLAGHIFNKYNTKEKYYIHPDSYHIFKPKAGDLIRAFSRSWSGDGELISYVREDLGTDQFLIEDNVFVWSSKFLNTIERGNKLFFQPLTEQG